MTFRLALAWFLLVGTVTGALGQPGEPPDVKETLPPDGLKALQHPDPQVRFNSLAILGRLGSVAKFAVPEVRKVLTDKNAMVRVKACETLWILEQPLPSVLVPVLTGGLQDAEPEVRQAAAGVLRQLGSRARKAVPELRAALKDKDEGVRLEAVEALGAIGPASRLAAPDLLELVGDDPLSILPPVVAVALGNIGAGAVPTLEEGAKSSSPTRRCIAAEALGLIGPDAASAGPVLLGLLGDAQASVREQAALSLGRIGDKSPPTLKKLAKLGADPDPAVRQAAAVSLVRLDGKADHLHGLTATLTAKDLLLRRRACRLLGDLGPLAEKAAPQLAKVLDQPEPEVREAAALNLGRLGKSGTAALERLEQGLQDASPLVRLECALAQFRISGKAEPGVGALRKAIEDKEVLVRYRAVRYLGEFGSAAAPAANELRRAAEDDDAAVRREARAVLKKIAAKKMP